MAISSSQIQTVIRPRRGWQAINFTELWQYRDLLIFLAWRDISVRYKQTVLGAAWAVIQPFFSMVIFSVFFGYFMRVPSDNVPYPLFSYAALLPWGYFATAVTSAAQSLIDNEKLLTKVYFPRLIIPVASILPALLDFMIAFVLLIVMFVGYRFLPDPASRYYAELSINVIWLPAFLLLALITALGVGLWISALNVQYRDFRYVIVFLIQLWLFASPVTYSASVVPQTIRPIYGINPMVGVIEGFRWALLGTEALSPLTLLVSTMVALGLLISGMLYFRRMERVFADVV
jgi:lipopolysaccharide transport system permease protein